jgi:CheY-like chemotaxis protein
MPLTSRRHRMGRTLRSHPALARKSILIVEDEPLVALGIHATLSATGASVLSASTVAEATRLLSFADVAAAIVDVQLGSQDAGNVCKLLSKRQIPFIFYTGRADIAPLRARWPHTRILRKPASPQEVVSALADLFVAEGT